MAFMQHLVPGVLSGVAGLAQTLVGAPAWAVVGCLALSLGLGALQVVFPQESTDRLSWWRYRWAYLVRRKELRNVRALERRQTRAQQQSRRRSSA
ncbi:hypothetical protein ACGFOU_33705 [Streptomyces sp. NPDC048595]|uniref:hypothetical protein n=1 Tax=Streptomyces sp. NPDC048595 TaxID=3365576 RepID=UPI00371C8FBD